MNDDRVKVDAIVVGGGPGGLAAGLAMAREGLEVIVVERGEYAGAKNVGGLVYGTVLNTLIENAHEKAPIERTVSRRSITYLGDGQHTSLTFGCDEWSQPPYNNTYIVHRTQFDRWFAKQVEDAGATLVEGMVVDDLIYEGSNGDMKAVGVNIRGDDPFYADVIILADGANCVISDRVRQTMSFKAGKIEQEYAVAVKEIISLPKEKIDDRFNVRGNEGVAYDYMGVPFDGMVGGGFIYTAKDSLHIGAVARISSMVGTTVSPNALIDKFKRHPVIARYVEGGELLEYSGHMLPEGGYDAVGQLAHNGVMIVGDAAGLLNASLYKEGTNHAMESGKLAGETAVAAKARGDFSTASLSAYESKLRDSVALRDLEKYSDLGEILDGSPELLSLYPKKVTQMLVDYFTVSGETKAETQKNARKRFMADLPKLKFLRDGLKARKLL